jgi:signal transduction histidine kinase
MINKKLFLIIVLWLLCLDGLFAQHTVSSQIDSAIAVASAQKQTGNFVKTSFFIADEYMNIEQYDAAQIWLNKIHAVLPVKNITLDNYFLLSRQAEVYYYNNLQQLGLLESRRSLAMAEALHDSLLLADSYNFLGLFYMNIDSAAASVNYYKQGLLFSRQPPNPPQYLSLSKPHHLHGNLAEAYYKQQQFDSALLHYNLSYKKALEINWKRGIAVALTGLGEVYAAKKQNDSALKNYSKGATIAMAAKDIDVALVCYSGIANSNYELNNMAGVDENLNRGFALLHANANINRFYGLNFLNTAINIYRRQQNNALLVKTLELKSKIEKVTIDGNNKQIQTILNAGMDNEKRILNMEVEDARQKQKLANTRLIMALAGIAFLVVAFLVYRYFKNQKLTVSKIRQKISQDLHDDIGASLSSLQIYGTIAQQVIHSNPAKTVEMLNKINVQSRQIMDDMSDIVWSMKSNSSSTTSLETKIKNFAANLLNDKNIQFTCIIQPDAETALENFQARKNILLIIKEILNNTAKYSEATMVSLHIYTEDKNWILQITDNGKGFNTNEPLNGNGVANIKSRCAALNGNCLLKTESGTHYLMVFPLTSISDNGW